MTTVPQLGYEKLMRMGDLRAMRIRDEAGFTFIEMLVVLVVIAVLAGIAVPAYLGYRGRASNVGAGANVRQALPAVQAYYTDHGTYVGMTPAALRAEYDAALDSSLVVTGATATGYCVQATLEGRTWSLTAGGAIAPGSC